MTDRRRLIAAALGEEKADLVIKRTKALDVFSGEWMTGDVAVCGDTIVGVGAYSGAEEIDGEGKYVVPTYCDAHLHFESAAVRPSGYLSITIPRGVTSYNADPHEIANVCGEAGIAFMARDVRGLPADVRFMMPSCVPATGEDSSGAVLDAEAVRRCKRELGLFGLGEMMNVPGVLARDAGVMDKLEAFDVVDGHAPGLTGNALGAYAAAGVMTDHECTTPEEAEERVKRGMYVIIREGSQARDLRRLIKAVNGRNFRRFMFCTDDRNLEDVCADGTIDNCVRLAVSEGMDVKTALTIASHNACAAYGLKNKGAIAPGYAADLIITRDPVGELPEAVFYGGRRVAENGRALFSACGADASGMRGTVRLAPLSDEDFTFAFKRGMPVIEVFPGTLYTKLSHADDKEAPDLMCCIERHRASGEIGHAYVKGFGIKGGALAQTVGHDSHNVTVIGDNARDMRIAVEALGADGGFAAASGGRVTGKVSLDIAGLMSSKSVTEALEERKHLREALRALPHAEGIEPFMLLSFLSLTVIPEAKLNTKGLYDVTRGKYVYKG